MQSCSFDEDPQPELPDCFCNQAYVEKLVKGLKSLKNEGFQEALEAEPLSAVGGETAMTPARQLVAWQPETLFRTCLILLRKIDIA
jgi:hypothetical protein